MDIMGKINKFRGGPSGPTGRSVVVLTPLGKSKAEKFDLPGAKWRVLSILNESGPSSISELGDETGMGEQKVKAICKALLAEGYVKKAGAID